MLLYTKDKCMKDLKSSKEMCAWDGEGEKGWTFLRRRRAEERRCHVLDKVKTEFSEVCLIEY